MPRFDGTGPQGQGPMTRRVFGRCNPAYQAGQQPTVISGEKSTLIPGETVQATQPLTQGQTPVFGVGRGGVPCGGGRGYTFGGRGGKRGRCSR